MYRPPDPTSFIPSGDVVLVFALGLPLSGRSDLCTSNTLTGNGLSEALKESAAATQLPFSVDDYTGLFIRSYTWIGLTWTVLFRFSAVGPVLLGLMENWLTGLGREAKWWNNQMKVSPTLGYE